MGGWSRWFITWQLLDHWGNRKFYKPSPRADMLLVPLVAALPERSGAGRFSPYARLVAARLKGTNAKLARRIERDPRYAPFLEEANLEANVQVVRAASSIAAALLDDREAVVVAVGKALEGIPITVKRVTRECWRLRPWPMMGSRLSVVCFPRPSLRLSFWLLAPSEELPPKRCEGGDGL